MTIGTLMTADELLQLPDDGWRYELVRGELRKMSPAGVRHSRIALRIATSLSGFVEEHALGEVYGADCGFKIERNPDSVREPDAAFVRADRVVDTEKFFDGPPDAAFEVISPNDSYSEVEEKTLEWLRGGTRAVVIVDPRTKSARVHRASSVTILEDGLEIDDVIPGWRLPLAELFA